MPFIRTMLGESNDGVRQSAALALRKIGGPRAIDSLAQALRDRNICVREIAAWALEILKIHEL
jgi:HEAT repeat protein